MRLFAKTIAFIVLLNFVLISSVLAKSNINYSQIVGTGMVTGVMIKNVNGFSNGEVVEILMGEKQKKFKVKSLSSGKVAWVDRSALAIESDDEIYARELDKEVIEGYINSKNFKNVSKYLLWVDIVNQKTYVLVRNNNAYKLYKTMPCSTGINTAPTTRGVFRINQRGKWFYSSYYRQGFKYWVRFNGPYLFHSLPMDKGGKIVDYTLGKKASHGCVRLSLSDAYWIYKNIPNNTIVYVN
ncbi:putative L,D-transpeptidase YciB precursor [Caloramator mitchellensis]|uniref:Putative L,D-transpeptidase YciB n=1 Tax=Caloramator mitchellensis TaxID=908809 RepID=A0A0R3JYT2_CALMK|nr:L,D-transpeptidase [Caloramator mitchellensis]KRQ86398.1 putative L,D-transpeptidase YciB precursor [Caloramator mitchellensis]